MITRDIARAASKFLEEYLEERDWFTPPDQVVRDYLKREASLTNVLMVFGTRPKGEGLQIGFVHGRDVNPKKHDVEARIKECIAALREALPELVGVEITWSLLRE